MNMGHQRHAYLDTATTTSSLNFSPMNTSIKKSFVQQSDYARSVPYSSLAVVLTIPNWSLMVTSAMLF